ncbi:OmpH family outer membrane protein [Wielerella bovis]|nr:OmpH family outer membrane protein [Wielerella bovis]ULJ60514.1 OmpH family outer membrane protein [Wielerella bovis]
MMKKQTIKMLSAAILLTSSLNVAAEMKLGYVNPERVYTETQAARRIEARLQQEFSAQQQALTKLQQEGIDLRTKIAQSKNANERKRLEAQLEEKAQQYRVASARLSEEFSLVRNEEFAALQNNANAIIKNIAEKEKYDLIVQEAVFVTRKYDITDRVIKLLDEIK